MNLRPAIAADLPALSEFAGRVFSENFGHLYHPGDLEKHLRNTCSASFFESSLKNGDAIFIAEEETIAGYVKAGKVGLPANAPHPDAMEIHRLYIDAPHQGKAVGKMLMTAALEWLQNAPEIYLGVWEHNHRAQAFYRSFGFQEVGEYLYQVGTVFDRELIMKKIQFGY